MPACTRVQMALPLAVETCWKTTMRHRPRKPGGLRRSAGMPAAFLMVRMKLALARQCGDRCLQVRIAFDSWELPEMWALECRLFGATVLPPFDSSPTVHFNTRHAGPTCLSLCALAQWPAPSGACLLGADDGGDGGAAGGHFLLRIEDIDLARSRPEHVAAIFEDLAWLGLTWEEPALRQSQHFLVYAAALRQTGRARCALPLLRRPGRKSGGGETMSRSDRSRRGAALSRLRSILSEAEIARRLSAGPTRCASTWPAPSSSSRTVRPSS